MVTEGQGLGALADAFHDRRRVDAVVLLLQFDDFDARERRSVTNHLFIAGLWFLVYVTVRNLPQRDDHFTQLQHLLQSETREHLQVVGVQVHLVDL